MDFLSFDTRKAAEVGRKVQIRAQQTGDPIFDGETECCFYVRGISSRSYQAAIKAEHAARMKSPRSAKAAEDATMISDIHDNLVKSASRLITGFSAVQRMGDDGKLRDLATSDDDIKWFLDLNFLSMEHLVRSAALTIGPAETLEEFEDRKEEYEARWHKPSFAQQVLDAAQDEGFLPKALKG
ncbi:MAG: hypothetical protein Q7V53_02075 [Caldisericota bacterium]|nr:hypothetical protein [Caldisericota bacterium]